ncbi:MAG: hypothetical protein R3F39_25370 [Myxococcota bacterium]
MHRGLRSLASPRSLRPALGALSIIATALFAGCPDDGRRNNEGSADALDTVGGPSDTADAGDPGADLASDTPTANDGADATELPAVLCADGSCDCLAQNIGVGYVRDDGT